MWQRKLSTDLGNCRHCVVLIKLLQHKHLAVAPVLRESSQKGVLRTYGAESKSLLLPRRLNTYKEFVFVSLTLEMRNKLSCAIYRRKITHCQNLSYRDINDKLLVLP